MTQLHPTAIDERGERYGRLVVLRFAGRASNGKVMWLCRCDCGTETEVVGNSLRRGNTTSCGCYHAEQMVVRQTIHGHKRRGLVSPTYVSWCSMLTRCTNPNAANYKWYGGRGVTIDERWMAFEDFLADMGERPEGTSLDRIDPNGNYEPGNCRWVDPLTQRRNRRPDEVLP